MTKRISVANSMPLTFAVIGAAFVAGYMLSALIAEEEIGRPSSTAAIGYLFVPIYSAIVGLGCLVLGFIVRIPLKGRGDRDRVPIGKFFLIGGLVLLGTTGFAVINGIQGVVAREEFNSPKVLSNVGKFERAELDRDVTPSVGKHALPIWYFQDGSLGKVLWNGKEVKAEVKDSVALKITVNGGLRINYDVRDYSYLTRVDALIIPNNKKGYLAILAKLRATSFRSILLVYDENGNLLYKELLRRCGQNQYMGTVEDFSGHALVVDICSPIIIRPSVG